MPTIRTGTIDDLPLLAAFDTAITSDPRRSFELHQAIKNNQCWVCVLAGQPIGYAVVNHHFYHQAFLALLYVDPEQRGQGIGAKLLEAVEAALAGTPKLFTSTNQSNRRMQKLLNKHGYKVTGNIEGLDDGDPEIFYLKQLV